MVQFMSNGFDWSWVFALFSFQKEIVEVEMVWVLEQTGQVFLKNNLSKLLLK